MKIAMFSRFPEDPDKPRGGVESATVGLIRGLAARKEHELHVITLERGRSGDSVEKTELATIHRLGARRLPMIADVFGGPGRRRIDQCIASLKPDVAHFQETYGFGGPYRNIPTVFTVHGFDSLNLETERKYLWRLRAPLWSLAESRGIACHHNLISIAPYVTDKLAEFTTEEPFEIPNAISASFFEIANRPVKGRIFFAGWINRRKNLKSAIRAIYQLRKKGLDVSLRAAGDFCDEEYLAGVRGMISRLGMENAVCLLGRIGQERLREELSAAELFLLPSLQENAPMAIAEAMAAGLPVVTSNVCGMPTMVEEGRGGFLTDPEDVDAIADRVARVIEQPELRLALGKFAREKSLRTFHPDSVVTATLDIYEKIKQAA